MEFVSTVGLDLSGPAGPENTGVAVRGLSESSYACMQRQVVLIIDHTFMLTTSRKSPSSGLTQSTSWRGRCRGHNSAL